MRDYFKVVAQVLQQELRAVAADQQSLADHLAPLAAADPALVRRLQDFDALRQRLDMLARVAASLENGGDMDEGAVDAMLAKIEVASVRDAFARRLGREVSAGGADDVELF
jgi:Lon protease-like protein